MEALDFYQITTQTLKEFAKEKGITNLERYYELTDFSEGSFLGDFLNKYKGQAKIFAQLAFHAQNRTMLSSIVKFEKNNKFIANVLCGFDTQHFLSEYPDSEEQKEKSINRLIDAFRYTDLKGEGIEWNSSKSKSGKKDTLMHQYAKALIESAAFVASKKDRDSFLGDLLNNYPNKNFRKLIKYFKTRITTGFSVALTCDFLKEFDKAFIDIPKPDVHIQDVMRVVYEKPDNYFNGSDERNFECIDLMQKLTKDINMNLESKVTVYQLDRMIWLICSGNFYLDNTEDPKAKYLQALQNRI